MKSGSACTVTRTPLFQVLMGPETPDHPSPRPWPSSLPRVSLRQAQCSETKPAWGTQAQTCLLFTTLLTTNCGDDGAGMGLGLGSRLSIGQGLGLSVG